MSRRSISARYDRSLERGADELAGEHLGPPLSPVHEQTLDVMMKLLGLVRQYTGEDTPPALRTFTGLLERMRPTFIEQLRTVPPEGIVEFMTQLRDDMDSIIAKGGSSGDRARGSVASVE